MVRASGIGHRASGIGHRRSVALVLIGSVSGILLPAIGLSRQASAQTQALTYPQAVVVDGAVSHWRLGDLGSTAVDLIGGRNGTYSQTVGRLATGAIAADQNGAVVVPQDATISFPVAGLPSGTQSRTLEFWMKSQQNRYGELVRWGDDSILTDPQDGFWHHEVVVYSNGRYTNYRDGALRGVTPKSVSMTGSIAVGFYLASGSLDELAIYPSALTSTQIHRSLQS
jgi:Concanavalin A-like lectin/glucanases superfamily